MTDLFGDFMKAYDDVLESVEAAGDQDRAKFEAVLARSNNPTQIHFMTANLFASLLTGNAARVGVSRAEALQMMRTHGLSEMEKPGWPGDTEGRS